VCLLNLNTVRCTIIALSFHMFKCRLYHLYTCMPMLPNSETDAFLKLCFITLSLLLLVMFTIGPEEPVKLLFELSNCPTFVVVCY